MAEKKQVVLAVFDNEEAADKAVAALDGEDKITKHEAVGVLVMDDKGKIKTHKMGAGSTGKGASIGLVLALLTPVGLGVGVVGGGIIGKLRRKGMKLTEEDRNRITTELKEGHAVVGVLAPPDKAVGVTTQLVNSGGRVESHETTDEALEEAAKEAPAGAPASS